MTRCLIALGSNLGDRGATVIEAVRLLAATEGVEVTAASTLVETVALTVHGPDESAPGYLNGVVLVETTLTPELLLAAANAIEAQLGRLRGERWADRTIDIDLVDYAGETRDSEHLTLPHPRAAQRAFVLGPWLEVEPDALLGGVPVADLLEAL